MLIGNKTIVPPRPLFPARFDDARVLLQPLRLCGWSPARQDVLAADRLGLRGEHNPPPRLVAFEAGATMADWLHDGVAELRQERFRAKAAPPHWLLPEPKAPPPQPQWARYTYRKPGGPLWWHCVPFWHLVLGNRTRPVSEVCGRECHPLAVLVGFYRQPSLMVLRGLGEPTLSLRGGSPGAGGGVHPDGSVSKPSWRVSKPS